MHRDEKSGSKPQTRERVYKSRGCLKPKPPHPGVSKGGFCTYSELKTHEGFPIGYSACCRGSCLKSNRPRTHGGSKSWSETVQSASVEVSRARRRLCDGLSRYTDWSKQGNVSNRACDRPFELEPRARESRVRRARARICLEMREIILEPPTNPPSIYRCFE